MSSKNHKKMMGFAPNNILYKSPTSIGLENQETNPNEKKKKKKKLASITRKKEKKKTPKTVAQMSSMLALIPVEENLNSIGSHVNI